MYKDFRKNYLKNRDDWDLLDTAFDESWGKLTALVEVYNSSVELNLGAKYVDRLYLINFDTEDTVYHLYQQLYGKPSDTVYFRTAPKTLLELGVYIDKYQDLMKSVFEYSCDGLCTPDYSEYYVLKDGKFAHNQAKESPQRTQPKPQVKPLPKEETIPAQAPAKAIPKPIDYSIYPERCTKETFRESKDCKSIYDKAQAKSDLLFNIYLDGLIRSMADKYPDVVLDVPYPHLKKKKSDTKKGRGDFVNIHDGLFMQVHKSKFHRISNKKYISDVLPSLISPTRYIRKIYSESTITRYFRECDCIQLLHDMIVKSAIDIQPFEDNFAIDGTGFSTNIKNDYYAGKHHNGKKETEWVNLQALTPVRSSLVVVPYIYFKYESDERVGINILIKEAQDVGYTIDRLSADKLYGSKDARKWLHDNGVAHFYCEFKDNVNPPNDDDNSQWAVEFRFWRDHKDEFDKLYHVRSNVESVFSAIKCRTGEEVTSRTMSGYFKEVYAKILVYNIYGMITQLFLNGIVPSYVDEEEIKKALGKV